MMVHDSSEYFRNTRGFFRNHVFPENENWPDVILAPSFFLGYPERQVVDVEVMILGCRCA